MKFKHFCLLFLGMMTLTACSGMLSSTSFTRDLSYTDTGVHRPDEFPILHATGYATISRQSGRTQAEKEINAMRASKIEAYRELTEQVNGIYVKADTALDGNSRQIRNGVKAQVEGYVHGARVIRQYPLGDTYATELELDTKIIYDLYDLRGAL